MKKRDWIYNDPTPANAGHGEPEHNHHLSISEGWEVEIGNITIYILRLAGTSSEYTVTIQEDGIKWDVHVGMVKGYAQARPLIDAIRKIKDT